MLAMPRLFVNFLKIDKKRGLYFGVAVLIVSIFLGLFFLFGANQRGDRFPAGLLTGLLEERVAEEQPVPEEPVVEEVAETGNYLEVAQAGDGLTHIARRALSRYLAEKEIGLDAEQKIFIEDFIQIELGSRDLFLGEEILVDQTLISQAVELSQQLQPEELENLKQYSALVIF